MVELQHSTNTHLIFTPSITLPPLLGRSVRHLLEYATRVSAYGLPIIWVEERYEEKRHVVLPRDTAVRAQVYFREQIAIPICAVRDEQLGRVYGVVYVPSATRFVSTICGQVSARMRSQDHAAESETAAGDCAQEFLLGLKQTCHYRRSMPLSELTYHVLSSQDAIDWTVRDRFAVMNSTIAQDTGSLTINTYNRTLLSL